MKEVPNLNAAHFINLWLALLVPCLKIVPSHIYEDVFHS